MFAGIAPEKYEKAKTVMLEQLQMIKTGDVSNEEFYAVVTNIDTGKAEYKKLDDFRNEELFLLCSIFEEEDTILSY